MVERVLLVINQTSGSGCGGAHVTTVRGPSIDLAIFAYRKALGLNPDFKEAQDSLQAALENKANLPGH